jgi:hypothetical protein
MRPELTLGAVVLLLLTACGGDPARDSQTERGEEYVEAIMSAVEGEPANLQEDVRCVMARFVDIIGLDALDEAGVTPEELWEAEDFPAVGLRVSENQARAAVNAFFGCTDLAELFVPSESSEEEKECARNALENKDSELRSAMKEDLLGSDEVDFAAEIEGLLIDECDISIDSD